MRTAAGAKQEIKSTNGNYDDSISDISDIIIEEERSWGWMWYELDQSEILINRVF